MSPARLFASIPNRISSDTARFENSHADHDPGESVVRDNDAETSGHLEG
jgi:hypothetical protein